MLTLKNKFSGYLLALSVPISGAFIQISNYHKHKTFCNRQVFNFLLYKLRMSKPSQIAFTNTRVTFYIVLIIITAESLVQLLRFINKLRMLKKKRITICPGNLEKSNNISSFLQLGNPGNINHEPGVFNVETPILNVSSIDNGVFVKYPIKATNETSIFYNQVFFKYYKTNETNSKITKHHVTVAHIDPLPTVNEVEPAGSRIFVRQIDKQEPRKSTEVANPPPSVVKPKQVSRLKRANSVKFKTTVVKVGTNFGLLASIIVITGLLLTWRTLMGSENNIHLFISAVVHDFTILGFSIYYLVTSNKILQFVKCKCNQIKQSFIHY